MQQKIAVIILGSLCHLTSVCFIREIQEMKEISENLDHLDLM